MLALTHKGFSLTELMVAMAISTVLAVALIMLHTLTLQNSQTSVDRIVLQQELQGAISMISNDVRRAGYWVDSYTDAGTGLNQNPFMGSGVFQVSSDCILLAYDKDKNGIIPALGAGSDDNRYGYRLLNGAIQTRISSDSFSCSGTSGWENITDPNRVEITGLTFSLNNDNFSIDSSSGADEISIKTINIDVSARSVKDTSFTINLDQSVRVQNDEFN